MFGSSVFGKHKKNNVGPSPLLQRFKQTCAHFNFKRNIYAVNLEGTTHSFELCHDTPPLSVFMGLTYCQPLFDCGAFKSIIYADCGFGVTSGKHLGCRLVNMYVLII